LSDHDGLTPLTKKVSRVPGVAAELAEGGDDSAADAVVHGQGQLVAVTRQPRENADGRGHPCHRNHQPDRACHRRPGDCRDDSCCDRGQHGAPVNARHDGIVLAAAVLSPIPFFPFAFHSLSRCLSFAEKRLWGFGVPLSG